MKPTVILTVLLFATGCGAVAGKPATPAPSSTQTFNTAGVLDFNERVDRYMSLRRRAVEELGTAAVTDDSARLRAREEALATRMFPSGSA